jgi:hypothetical protein
MEQNKQQTAVDWLFEQIPHEWTSTKYAFDAYKQAKEMEKEQHYNTWDESRLAEGWKTFQKYYNETYGQQG